MSAEELERKKLEVELSKLLAEEEKVREEIRHLKMPALLNPKVAVAFLVALIGLATTGGKLYFTTIERDQAVAEEEATGAYADNLQKENVLLAKETKSSGATVSQLTKAVIKFRGSITREQISGLQLQFNNSNFVAPRPFRTSAIEATEILYFDDDDLRVAESLKIPTIDYFKHLECPLKSPLTVTKKESEKYGKGSIVVSIFHKCG